MQPARMIVSLPEEELDRIYRVCKPDYRRVWHERGWQAIFSCNRHYECWPTIGLGNSEPEQREHLVLEDFPHLWQIVSEVLRWNRKGGRVFVKDDRFFIKPYGRELELDVGVLRRAPVATARTRHSSRRVL